MKSKVIAFRLPYNVYQEFEKKCKDEGVNLTVKLRELIDTVCHPVEVNTDDKAQVKVIKVEGEKLEKVTDTRVKSWFPLDFSLLFGKD